jgi:hypothetical protein
MDNTCHHSSAINLPNILFEMNLDLQFLGDTLQPSTMSLNILDNQPISAVQKRSLQPLRSLPALGGDAKVFLNAVVDRMCGVSTTLPSFDGVSASDVAILADSYEFLFANATRTAVDAAQLGADLTTCGVPDTVAGAVVEVALARRDEVRRAAIRGASQLATASLAAFDWKVHALVSSDRAAMLQEPLALLQLRLNRGTPRTNESVVVELTADDLARLIETLQRVNSQMEELAS